MHAADPRPRPVRRSARSRARRTRRASAGLGAAIAAATVAALLVPPVLEGRRALAATRVTLALPHHEVVRQSHPQGCAAALLATLLARRGLPGDEAGLLAAAPPGPSGIDLARFARLAAAHGLPGRWRRSLPHRLPQPPFVAHLDRPHGHFVWVSAGAGDYLRVTDPARGEGVWHVSTFASRFSGRYFALEDAS